MTDQKVELLRRIFDKLCDRKKVELRIFLDWLDNNSPESMEEFLEDLWLSNLAHDIEENPQRYMSIEEYKFDKE